MRRYARALCFLSLMALCIGCDRITKDAAVESLRHTEPVALAGGMVHLEYAENHGAFLSLGDALQPGTRFWIFVIGTSVLLFAIAATLVRRANLSWPTFVSLSLVLAGGIGNLLDRASAGYVVDFVQIGIGPVHTGIFNMADLAITSGVLGLVFSGWRSRRAVDPRHGAA
jgi:signal peptidase II